MVPITCNAVGDIIALASLLLNVARALSDTQRSVAEYRSFADEIAAMSTTLNAMQRIILGIDDEELCSLAVMEVQRCCPDIQQAIEKTAKFSALSLSKPSQQSRISVCFQRQWYKLEWRFLQRGEIRALEDRFNVCRQRLTLIVAALNSGKIDRCATAIQNIREDSDDRLTSLSQAVTSAGIVIHSNTRNLNDSVSRFALALAARNLELNEQVSQNTAVVRGLRMDLVQYFTSFARVTPTTAGYVIGHNAQELGNALALISEEHTLSQRMLSSLKRIASQIGDGSISREYITTLSAVVIVFSALEVMNQLRIAILYATIFTLLRIIWKIERYTPPTVTFSTSNTISLIDVIGDRVALPMQLCESPDIFHSTVLNLFSKKKGLEFVRRRAYEIEDVGTASLVLAKTWSTTVRPGMEIAMSIVLHRTLRSGMQATCPWCGESVRRPEADVRRPTSCSSCFRAFHTSLVDAHEQKSSFLDDIDDRVYPSLTGGIRDDDFEADESGLALESIRPSAAIDSFQGSLEGIRRIHVVLAGGTSKRYPHDLVTDEEVMDLLGIRRNRNEKQPKRRRQWREMVHLEPITLLMY